MYKLFRLLLLTTISLFTGASAVASEIQCDAARLPAEQQICDHPILKHHYERILEQQQGMRQAGTLSDDQLNNWAASLADCADVHCVDIAFNEWDAIARKKKPNTDAEVSSVGSMRSEKAPSHTAVERRAQDASHNDAAVTYPSERQSAEATSSATSNSENKAKASDAANGEARSNDSMPGYIKLAAVCFVLLLLSKVFGKKRDSEAGETKHARSNRSSKMQSERSEERRARQELELDQRELNRQAKAIQTERERDVQRAKEERKRQEEAEKRRAIEKARELAKCKFCGSASFGTCFNSPHKRHEHLSDGKHCVFCGSTSNGTCFSSPFKRHQR